MSIVEILDHYDKLAEEILHLLQTERGHLRAGQPTEDLHEHKRGLIAKLTTVVDSVRAYRESRNEDISFVSERLQFVQQRLMKILQLDREVEKLFLGSSMRPAVPELVPVASRVGQAYQSASTQCSR